MTPKAPHRYLFRDCLLDTQRRELRVRGTVVPLQPRAFDLLALLVQRPGQALSRDELIAAVWPTTHVTDAVLSMAAARIRKAIGDDGNPPMLATLHGIGYRFDAKVRVEAAIAAAAQELPPDEPPLAASQAFASNDAQTHPKTEALLTDAEFWEAQWQRVLTLEQAGNAQAALSLVEQAGARWATLPALPLVAGRLQRKRLRLQEAESRLQAGLQSPASAPFKAELLLELAKVAMLRYDLNGARELVDRIKEDAAEGQVAAQLLPGVLALLSRLVYLSDGYARLLAVTEQIERLAVLPRDAGALSTAAVATARALHNQALQDQALTQAVRGARLAETHGANEEASDAYRFVATLARAEDRVEYGLTLARRALAFAEPCGDLYHWQSAMTQLCIALVNAGRLDETEHWLQSLRALGHDSQSAIAQFNLGVAESLLLWRRGEMEAAVQQLGQLLERFRQRSIPIFDMVYSLAQYSLSLGRTGPALQLLDADGEPVTEVQRSLLKAGVLLVQGDREGSKRVLKRASLNAGQPRTVGAAFVARSLALMQIEDGEAQGLAALLDQLRPLREEHPAVRLLFDLHALRFEGREISSEAWADHAQRCCGLRNRHAWFLTPDGLEDWLAGRRHFGELLYRAWF